MAASEVLRHVIPQLGLQEVVLHPPAESVYTRLQAEKEVERLNQLRHLGALSRAFPGTRQARWDYTFAMLHYSSELRVPGMNSRFRLGRVEFSSAIAALQTIALLWNVGHLPGTFSVEKGVYRYMHSVRPDEPAEVLIWPHDGTGAVSTFKSGANRLLQSYDYLGLARVLAVIKVLSFSAGTDDDLHPLFEEFAGRFLLEINLEHSGQWPKLRRAFRLIRHLAYLTLDAPFTGLSWMPRIPVFLQQTLASGTTDLSRIDAKVSEVLSPIERSIYESVYHSPEARRESALVAEQVVEHLSRLPEPAAAGEIQGWMGCGLFEELDLGRTPSPSEVKRVVAIRLRSHFSLPAESPAELEDDLKQRGFTHAAVFQYPAWNSDILLEPDELIIDVMTTAAVTANQVGKVILWIISRLDNLSAQPDDVVSVWIKNELESAYASLLSSAIQLCYEGVSARLEPWRLREFGLFPDGGIAETRGAIWASTARLDDRVTRYLVRDRSKSIPSQLRDQYAELMGLRELRLWLRRKWAGKKELRQRWLVVTSSVQFCRDSRRLIEFDGGLVKLSTRSGRMTWYGLESKTGGGSPLHSLNRRIRVLGITGNTHSLTSRYAVLELPL